MDQPKRAFDRGIMDVTISRRCLLKNTAKVSGGAFALSLLGGATILAGENEGNTNDGVTVGERVTEVADDRFWIGGF